MSANFVNLDDWGGLSFATYFLISHGISSIPSYVRSTHSDQLRWGAISGMGTISAQLFLDFAEKEMLNEFLEKIVGKIQSYGLGARAH